MRPHTGHRRLRSGPAALRNLRPCPAPPAPGLPGGGATERAAPLPRRPPPWQDSAGSAEQPFSAAASPPELSRAAGPGGRTAQGTPRPSALRRDGRPEPGRAGPGVARLRRRARRDNPTLSPPFCYRAGVFPKQRQSGSLGNGPPLCRGGRPPRAVSPFPPTPAAPHLAAGLVPGRAATAGTFPPGSPRSPSRPAHAAHEGRDCPSPCRTLSRGAGTEFRAAVPKRRMPERGPRLPFPMDRGRGAGHLLPPTPWAAQVP